MKIVNCYCDNNKDKKLRKKRLLQIKLLKIRYLLICILGFNKINFLKKHDIFESIGENVLYQPNKLPNNPKLIKIHNNVKIAANVIFYEHDIINELFQQIDNDNKYITHWGPIEIFDNVFIGGSSIIIGNVKIGPNAIIGAGSVITKDVPEGTIVAGNPAKIIGKFDDLKLKREKNETNKGNLKLLDRYEQLWNEFNLKKGVNHDKK